MDFTREQEMAIRLRDRDILVSAGAGAGKTRVLVNRICDLVMDEEHPVSIDHMLVMTFTNAAAAEMKDRIRKELEKRCQEDQGNRYLRSQMRAVYHADISTVHSFCNRMIRRNFAVLGIDPSYRIGNSQEVDLIKIEAMQDLLEQAYQEMGKDFVYLVEILSPGRDDRDIESMILKLHDKSREFPEPKEWLNHCLAVCQCDPEAMKIAGIALEPETLETFTEENKRIFPAIRELVRLAEDFENRFFAIKKKKNIFDYNDLEHFCLKLLVDRYDDNGDPVPSDVAKEARRRYEAVFVDEYQDTNMVQESIVKVLTDAGENNLFVVGDVKQSIYRFRQARPELFIRRYDRYRKNENREIAIELRDNFRSAPAVLDCCNRIFTSLMSREFGGIDYNDEVKLVVGEKGPMRDHVSENEFLLLIEDEEKENLDIDLDKLTAETMMIGRRISSLLEEGYQYKDMVILLRSASNKAEPMVQTLNDMGIPAECQVSTGFFDAREVVLILDYLAILDNRYQDIPLAAVLLSEIGGFTENDLVKVLLCLDPEERKGMYLWDMIDHYLNKAEEQEEPDHEDDLRNRLKTFVEEVEGFRDIKTEIPLNELIRKVLVATDLYHKAGLLPEGKKRQDNLLMLLNKAREYEQTAYKGLFYFIRYVERLKNHDMELIDGAVASDTKNVVRIMTIHKSKGLEFPVVFVSDLGKQFNFKEEQSEKMLLDPEMGIGIDDVDLFYRTSNPSVHKSLIRKKIHKENLEEELRVLYVAFTRAQEKLILTAHITQKDLEKWLEIPVNPDELLQARTPAKWLISCLSPMIKGEEKADYLKIVKMHYGQLNRMDQECDETDHENTLASHIQELRKAGDVTEDDLKRIEASLTWEYPYQDAVTRKRKYSVSELKMLAMASLPESLSQGEEAYDDRIRPLNENELSEKPVPCFLKEKQDGFSPTDRGTLVHKIFEQMPFGKIDTEEKMSEYLTKLEKDLPDTKKIDMNKVSDALKHFIFSPMGEKVRVADRQGLYQREWPFTIGIPMSIIDPSSDSEEMVVVQGIIDAFMETEEGQILIDYKTDRIRKGQEQTLIDHYREQLRIYRIALEQLTDRKVMASYLYSTVLGSYLPVE